MEIDDSDLLKIYDVIISAHQHHRYRDDSNARLHLAKTTRYSPLTSALEAAGNRLETLFRENHTPGWSGDPDEMVAGEQRYMPEWGSTVVKRREDGDYVEISDIFGGHEVRITKKEWDRLPVNSPDPFVDSKPARAPAAGGVSPFLRSMGSLPKQ